METSFPHIEDKQMIGEFLKWILKTRIVLPSIVILLNCYLNLHKIVTCNNPVKIKYLLLHSTISHNIIIHEIVKAFWKSNLIHSDTFLYSAFFANVLNGQQLFWRNYVMENFSFGKCYFIEYLKFLLFKYFNELIKSAWIAKLFFKSNKLFIKLIIKKVKRRRITQHHKSSVNQIIWTLKK